ncbi:MAG: DinB family protein [Gemmatimonadaceae bacterium]|nr:DinB family protein [Gemmatimonadaceae bacterium]NUR18205.1 DinB family protein [Gemmatimonadaceae bacterium]
MPIAASILPEFDHEMRTTRSLLERVPEAKAAWKPHAKSMSLGELAAHIANLVGWGTAIMSLAEFDFFPPGGTPRTPPPYGNAAELLQRMDANVGSTRAAIAAASDDYLREHWALKNGGRVIIDVPRVVALRSFMMNHVIHHRGQLSVYLRLNDVPLPNIYGPTADMS